VPPTPVRLTRCTLEGGLAAPSNVFSVLTQGHAVMSGRRDRSSPSLSTLCDHPRHCCTTPDTVATSRRCWGARGPDIATTATVPHTGPRQRHPRIGPLRRPVNQPCHRHPRSRSCTSTGRTTTPQQERDLPGWPSAPWRCSPSSTRRETVRHACKLLPPWPIKGGQSPSRGYTGRRTAIAHAFSASSTILVLASINTSGTCHPSTSTTVQAIECPEHTTAGRTALAGTRINPVSLVASTGPSRGRSQRSLLVTVGTTFRTDTRSVKFIM
jgi:hypothetical protein